MNCKCGGATAPHTHKVKTLRFAREWREDANSSDLPIVILNDICNACGRQHTIVINSNGDHLE
jgi:hypothetical protein